MDAKKRGRGSFSSAASPRSVHVGLLKKVTADRCQVPGSEKIDRKEMLPQVITWPDELARRSLI
jgi:hypothetical protein